MMQRNKSPSCQDETIHILYVRSEIVSDVFTATIIFLTGCSHEPFLHIAMKSSALKCITVCTTLTPAV